METPSERRLILILSSERSGSTLTRVILGGNSRIVAPQEMFLMRYPDYRTFRERHAVAIESLVEFFALVEQPRDAAAIDAACAGRSTPDVYQWLFGFLRPGELLLDKTPAYANDGDTLRRSLPLEPKMLEACGARRIMNVHLGDPTFHTRDRIDAGAADAWRQYFTEDRLTRETRRLMDAIGVVRDGG